METVRIICPQCFVCGEQSTIDVVKDHYIKWRNGLHAQNAFPEMPAEDREMLISGTHPACWDEYFGDADDSA